MLQATRLHLQSMGIGNSECPGADRKDFVKGGCPPVLHSASVIHRGWQLYELSKGSGTQPDPGLSAPLV